MNTSFSDIVLYFLIYSIIGWICEVAYCSIPAKRIVNRGFLAGPYCPIYGFGALIILFLLHPFMENPAILFIVAVIATTLLEYATSWLMEAMFNVRWWDYSDKKFNIHGRICLKNSLLFGVMGVTAAYLVHPSVSRLIIGIDSEYKRVIASLLLAAIAIDFVITLSAQYDLDMRLKKLKELFTTAEKYNAEYAWFDMRDLQGSLFRLEEICSKSGNFQMLDISHKIRNLTLGKKPGERLFAAFPTMKHRAFEERLSVFMVMPKDKIYRDHHSIRKTAKRWAEQAILWVRAGAASFASQLNFHELFWLFFISSVTGYVLETIFCFATRGYFESRQGLIYGPLNPLYGLGAVVMVVFLNRLQAKRDIWVFAGSAAIGGAFEFFCSYIQEKLLGTVSWDYSRKAFSIDGRTNLLYMFFWGILGVFLIKTMYPAMSRFVEKIPKPRGTVITWILVLFLSVNTLISAAAVARWTRRIDGAPPRNGIEEYLDHKYPDALLKEVYPTMKRVAM